MTGFETVDEPATQDEIDQWWGRLGVHLIGFTMAGHEGAEGLTHWVAVTTNNAEHVELYRLCGTMNDELPWARTPDENVTCMTCLVRAADERWKEPS